MDKIMTFQDLAKIILTDAPFPLATPDIWAEAEKVGLAARLSSTGKTPSSTLGARLYVDTKENPKTLFLRVGQRPVCFWLKARPLPKGWTETGPEEDIAVGPLAPVDVRDVFLEKDMHAPLAWFARNEMNQVRVKTVRHSLSSKKQFGEWVHPDLVGVRLPGSVFNSKITIDFANVVRAPVLRLFSFELKRSVDFSNLREAFFQAVSNSSWANEGYLVASRWLDEEEFNDELTRLSQSFGIGAIYLNVENPPASRIIRPARVRDELDWVTLDKLARMNPDVEHFLETVKIDLSSGRIHDSEYDVVPSLNHGAEAVTDVIIARRLQK